MVFSGQEECEELYCEKKQVTSAAGQMQLSQKHKSRLQCGKV